MAVSSDFKAHAAAQCAGFCMCCHRCRVPALSPRLLLAFQHHECPAHLSLNKPLRQGQHGRCRCLQNAHPKFPSTILYQTQLLHPPWLASGGTVRALNSTTSVPALWREQHLALRQEALRGPTLASTTSVPAFWRRVISALALSSGRTSRGWAWLSSGRMVTPAGHSADRVRLHSQVGWVTQEQPCCGSSAVSWAGSPSNSPAWQQH